MKGRELRRKQLDRLFERADALRAPVPRDGWIKSVRHALGMSLQQMAARMGVSKAAAADVERREKESRVTLRSMHKAADALDCELVYMLVPKEGSLQRTVEQAARQIAEDRVGRTLHTMNLEQQGTNDIYEEMVEDVTRQLLERSLRHLWTQEHDEAELP